MRNGDYFKDKKICIVGLARSGLACAKLLAQAGSQVRVTDNRLNEVTYCAAQELKAAGIQVELGRHSPEFIKPSQLIVVSPGVADTSDALVYARNFGIPEISEIEAAWFLCPATVIAVTGTNGKTTVTTLIGKILESAGKRVFVCGNIGNPFSGEIQRMKAGDFVSLEISSFQLEKIKTFKPKIAVMLNFSSNHLDRYKCLEDYLEAKKRIFMNQEGDDYLVLNSMEPWFKDLAAQARSKPVFFSSGVNGLPAARQGMNPNQAAVLAVASILGIDQVLCKKVFKDFKGVEHRLERAGAARGVTFINDSKATTVDATIWALRNAASPVILIAGGREKGNDYKAILGLVKEKVRSLILIGEAREKIKKAFSGYVEIEDAEGLKQAVEKAFAKAKSGDCVLFSPMCKSFDMFTDFEHRGRVFKEAVQQLCAPESK